MTVDRTTADSTSALNHYLCLSFANPLTAQRLSPLPVPPPADSPQLFSHQPLFPGTKSQHTSCMKVTVW